MGGKQSRHDRDHDRQQHEKQGDSSVPAGSETPATKLIESGSRESPAASPAAVPVPPAPTKVDVLISSTSNDADISLAKLIKDGLEDEGIPVYINCKLTDEDTKIAGKLVVDAKCLVYIASKDAAMNNVGQDILSLAYVSNKSIFAASSKSKEELITSFTVGMKMTLHQLEWFIFDDESQQDPNVQGFIEKIKQQILGQETSSIATTGLDSSSFIMKRGGRLNTKLRTRTTVQDFQENQPHIDTFWDRNFPSDDEVPWFKFQTSFLNDYDAQLSGLFNEENIPWLLEMLKNDVFEGAEKITKEQFMQLRGESVDKNAFWRVVSQIAVEKFNMKEVFDMNSSVRLTAIEKLAHFQNPAVVEALLKLLKDEDPNVRAVAAISLGRTGCTEERVVDALINLLKDSDRIVRQGACLSLGAMKATKAIPHISNIWRNDFISVVRNAARTALENMNIPEAKEVLSVTKVLEEEIETLQGEVAVV